MMGRSFPPMTQPSPDVAASPPVDVGPVREEQRIATLDVLRGFALLGILLLNILGFALPYAAYSNPGFDVPSGSTADRWVWASVEIGAEGAMRCLFSILFGAGVVLFAGDRAGRGRLHYRRTFWLLCFGLVDAFLLLWSGDILVTYAVAGALLFPLRRARPRTLLVLAGGLIVLMSLLSVGMQYGLGLAHDAYEAVQTADPDTVSDEMRAAAEEWTAFASDFQPTPEALADELAARRTSYATAFVWNAGITGYFLGFVLPVFLLWDALAMMLIGMALFRLDVLQGGRSPRFYRTLALVGLLVGVGVNVVEVRGALAADFDLRRVFAQMQPTYHLGRLAVALGYIGIVVLVVQAGRLTALTSRLSAVGRMALTNYLMHSIICLFVFTGAGLALVGELSRASIYVVVVAIWLLQLWLSPWWLARYRFGPLEWLWRSLTYGTRQPLAR